MHLHYHSSPAWSADAKRGVNMNKNTLVAVVLGVLVLISLVQAFQLSGLKNSFAGGATVKTTSTGQAVANSPAPSAAPQLPANINNLPDMVGGC